MKTRSTLTLLAVCLFAPVIFSACSKSSTPAPGPGTGPGPGPGAGPAKLQFKGTAQLSQARIGLMAAATGTRFLFAGGRPGLANSDVVDIYDASGNTWSAARLKDTREEHAAVAAGNKILVAGGSAFYSGKNVIAGVEIYDVTTGAWTFEQLRVPIRNLSAAGIQNKIFIAGGVVLDKDSGCCVVTKEVNIYDVSTGKWSYEVLSEARRDIGLGAAGSKVVFAGGQGHSNVSGGYFADKVDIYDLAAKTWSTARLSEARDHLQAVAAGNFIFFIGGRISNFSATPWSKKIDVYEVTTNKWSTLEMSEDREDFAVAAIGDKIVIAGGYSNAKAAYLKSVEVYDIPSGKWEKLELSIARSKLAAAAAGKKLLIGGGFEELAGFSKTVDIFELSQ
ncbi:hypothetical protein ECE50_008725 [Chitinophaga sp. Mgbs1]|uniref:Attractin/MKLN-like beta-propeller domain-containing protein n=1 Tax=Chitinophaga solisilvae TaxID=1233460 RepID=A0A433WQ55_9BACT|nr:hypothetical protein [Chitinophaga solisilvae]